jgi:hypothetical protein
VIAAATFCPHPPVLVPDIAGSAASELVSLRTACRTAIAAAAAPGRQLVLIGAGPGSAAHPPRSYGSLAGFGVAGDICLGAPAGDGAPDLPLSLTVGAWLVHDALGARSGAVGYSVGEDFATSPAATELRTLTRSRDVALLVLGDGSARRSAAAPGYLDDRAGSYDASVTAALAAGDAAALGALDARLGAELLAAGVPAWRAAATVLAGCRYDAQLTYDQAPYGVGYFVARWAARA